MTLNIFKKLFFISFVVTFFTGCNIYRQMVIPTPYYPDNNPQTITTNSSNQGVIEAQSDVNQNISTEQSQEQITPIQKDNVKVTNKTIVQRIPFPVDEYNSLAKTGSASVKGRIYLTTATGMKVYGKHTRLYLNPVTSYSTQWYNKSYLGGAKMSKVDPRLFNYLKFTTSDDKGNFEFLNVPNGSYYLIGVVKCANECGYPVAKTIRIAKKISVFGNETKVVDLSKTIN